jgi:hypothetical protein
MNSTDLLITNAWLSTKLRDAEDRIVALSKSNEDLTREVVRLTPAPEPPKQACQRTEVTPHALTR